MFPFLYCRDSCVIGPHRHLISNKAKWKHKKLRICGPNRVWQASCDFFVLTERAKATKQPLRTFWIYTAVWIRILDQLDTNCHSEGQKPNNQNVLLRVPCCHPQLVSTKTQNNMDMWTQSFAFLLDRHNKRWQETSWAMLEPESPTRAL